MNRAYRPRAGVRKVDINGASHHQQGGLDTGVLIGVLTMDTHDRSGPLKDRAVAQAADLTQVCRALGLEENAAAQFLALFDECLADYSALSIDPSTGALGIMTRGSGQAHAFRIVKFMEQARQPEAAIEQFLGRVRHFDAENIALKAEIDRRGVREVTTYVRQEIERKVAHACLADAGVNVASVGLMEAVVEALDSATVCAVATSVTVSGDAVEKIYLASPDAALDWGRVRLVGQLVGLSDLDWSPIDARRSTLSISGMELSLGFRGGRALPGVTLAFRSVSPEVVAGLLGSRTERETADRIRVLWDRTVHDEVRIRIVPGGPMGLKTCAVRAQEVG